MIRTDGVSGYLEHGSAVYTAGSYTLIAVIASDLSSGSESTMVAQSSNTVGVSQSMNYGGFSDNKRAKEQPIGTGPVAASKSTAPNISSTIPRWMISYFGADGNDRRIALGDTNFVTNTDAITSPISQLNRFLVGAERNAGSVINFGKADIGEVWLIAGLVNTTEMQEVISGTRLPENLTGVVDGWYLDTFNPAGTYLSHSGTRTLTASGTVTASSITHPVTRTPPADTTPPTLTGSITIGTVTDVSIQMSWPAGSDNVAVVGYDVSSNGGSSYTSLGNVLTHTFTGLSPSTSYGLRVRARDAAGNLSTPVLSATQSTSAAPDTTPPTMTGVVTPSAVGVTTATITWTAGSDNVVVTGYEYRLNGGSYVSVGNVLTTNLTGLTASTLYNVDVRAFDAANNKSAVVSGSFTTSAVADTTPPTLTGSISIGTVTASSIQFSWPAGSDNVAVVGYDVSLNGGTSYTSLGNVLTHTFTGLSASTIYPLRVRARDAAGNVSSALSSSQSTGSPSVTAKRIVVVLTSNGTTPAASLTNLKWAFFNEARPDLMNAPAAKGAIESTDASGVLEIDVSSSTLAIGQTGWLIITDSDGTITQNPPAKAFSAPVQVIE